jgi:hypothetical protein
VVLCEAPDERQRDHGGHAETGERHGRQPSTKEEDDQRRERDHREGQGGSAR